MHKKLTCWSCKALLDIDSISFRSDCSKCFQDQHVCINCKYYNPSKPNSCEINTSEYVKDKEKRNLCEDFSIKESDNSHKENFDKARELFKEDVPLKKIFDDLFK